MKNKSFFALAFVFLSFAFYGFSQKNVSVSIYDDIYELIDQAQMKGICSIINSAKPYTRSQISKAIMPSQLQNS